MRTHDVLATTATAATVSTMLHLGQALRPAQLGVLRAASEALAAGTLDGILASIHVGARGTRVAYRDEVGGGTP